jgi:predicted metal-binding protein
MTTKFEDLTTLCAKAKELGASRAVPLSVDLIFTDPRVRLKCQVPICPNYGRNLMCPPNTITLAEFAEALAKYDAAIIVQFDVEPDGAMLERIKGMPLTELEDHVPYKEVMTGPSKRMMEALGKLEQEAGRMGYRFAAALAAGPCTLCDICAGPSGPCRNPFSARPSMEAVGIDVIATADKAGVPIKYPAEVKAIWTGLLLVD